MFLVSGGTASHCSRNMCLSCPVALYSPWHRNEQFCLRSEDVMAEDWIHPLDPGVIEGPWDQTEKNGEDF